MSDAERQLSRLLAIMARLRDPVAGCPWDLAQDFTSIAPYTIEEAYEVADAIARRDMTALADELGDLLLQVVYHARMAEEAGVFRFADVARLIGDKMVRRHPHIFAPDAAHPTIDTAEAQSVAWEQHKTAERTQRREIGALAGVAAGLPALTRAVKLTRRAAQVGFDWPDAASVLDKLLEETEELRAELPGNDMHRLQDEMGDMLFVLANLARKLNLDPEACLRHANEKFTRRFNAVEQRLTADGADMASLPLARMEQEWQAVKATERAAHAPCGKTPRSTP